MAVFIVTRPSPYLFTLSSLCVSLYIQILPFYKDTSHMVLAPLPSDLMLTWLSLWRPCLHMRSHSEVLGVRTQTWIVRRTQFNPWEPLNHLRECGQRTTHLGSSDNGVEAWGEETSTEKRKRQNSCTKETAYRKRPWGGKGFMWRRGRS